jgi:proteasome lid subunit RPN8/RPN11
VAETPYLPIVGTPIAPEEVTLPRARAVVELLHAGTNPYARLVECRRSEWMETVIFDVDAEVPQLRAHDIRRRERIAAAFDRETDSLPETFALRADFPEVPHLNLRFTEFPRSLCLWEEHPADLKLRWTAAMYVARVQRWLALTARGELHGIDQPPEPLLLGRPSTLVLPPTFLEGGEAAWLPVRAVQSGETMTLLVDREAQEEGIQFVALWVQGEPVTHGVVRHQPTTLAQLQALLLPAGIDLRQRLRAQLRDWLGRDDVHGASLIVVLAIPRCREAGGAVESVERWAFLSEAPIGRIGEEIGLWAIQDGRPGLLLPPEDRDGAAIPVHLLNPTSALTREAAARLNRARPSNAPIVAIGAGALGSQVVLHLVRAGFGRWTVVDPDILLPHNLARHALPGYALGHGKAQALAFVAASLLAEEPGVAFHAENVLETAEHPAMEQALTEAEVVLDLSASVTAARHLAVDVSSRARRISLFLNPDGTDLVLLAEDAERRVRLDQLEMMYYGEVVARPELAHHLRRGGARLRYAHTCRDVTSELPQDAVATLSGVGARAIRAALEHPEAAISLWRTDAELQVVRTAVPVSTGRTGTRGAWTLWIDEMLLRDLRRLRERRLPQETGGVLIGSYDLQRRILYLVATVPSPPDSEEWPVLYVRGCEGLAAQVQEIEDRTAGWLQYVGEWHSHPAGSGAAPSADDRNVFRWIDEHLRVDGLPALMMIVAERETRLFLETMEEEVTWGG